MKRREPATRTRAGRLLGGNSDSTVQRERISLLSRGNPNATLRSVVVQGAISGVIGGALGAVVAANNTQKGGEAIVLLGAWTLLCVLIGALQEWQVDHEIK